jgi:MinD-like ATPase involved in chromosome partitioning or flagellar assembly
MDTAKEEDVTDSAGAFARESPWREPPAHRPARAADPSEPTTEPTTEPKTEPTSEPSEPSEPADLTSRTEPDIDRRRLDPQWRDRTVAAISTPASHRPAHAAPDPAPDPAPETHHGIVPEFRPDTAAHQRHHEPGPGVQLYRQRPGHPYQEIEVPLSYSAPTAEEFATRRAVRPREWVATTGVRGAARRGTFGLIRLRPNRREREGRQNLATVRRAFGGLRQITVVNPKGGAGKTVATLMLGVTFGQTRGGFVLAWDNNETQGTLGMRAQPDTHVRTVRDLLRDLDRFNGGGGRVGELASYVRTQDDAMFDVLASDEAATAGEMLTARAFRDLREIVGRFYKIILVDTGNNVRAENWQAAVDATDQLVITMSARNDSAETAARLLDHLEQTGRRELVRRAVTVVTMPPHQKDVNPRAIERHFDQRCRIALRVPYDRHLDSGAPVHYAAIAPESRRAWLAVAAAVADGL